jgi:hypothetical protein
MAVEPRRGCGFRKVGGLYLVSRGLGVPCCKMPIPLHLCPVCNQGIKQTRGFLWIDPKPWLPGSCQSFYPCPAANPEAMGEKVLLLWIGIKFYHTAEAFVDEANRLGVSRRIPAIPRGFKLGETWVFLAHPKAISNDNGEWTPGIFRIFRPDAIEKIITQSQSQDPELMAALQKKGMTPVVVPDDDPDHQGSVYQKRRGREPDAGIELLQ